MNVTGIMTCLQQLVEAFQEPQTEAVMEATGHLAEAVISTRAGLIFSESLAPVIRFALDNTGKSFYRFKDGVKVEKLWEEMEKAD